MSKPIHPSELDARQRIARAQSFSVYQYRYRARYMREGFGSIAEADAHSKTVEAEWPGRPTLIYAMCDGVALPVPADLRAAASAQSSKE